MENRVRRLRTRITATVEMHEDAVEPSERVLLVDDLLATRHRRQPAPRSSTRRRQSSAPHSSSVLRLPRK
ncbi:MAG: hypothetical protein R3F11_08890 [Verrucomicrobiales bacterium]